MRSLLAVIVALLAMVGCAEKEAAPAKSPDGNKTPTMITDSVNSFISDSGITRYNIRAPRWLMFDEADEPFWVFPQGLNLDQYDDAMQVNANVVCDSAFYFSRLKLWRLDGNVRVRNIKGDKFLTQQLYWDQNQHKIYSDSFIHIEREAKIIEGYGFTSNEHITSYTIRRPNASLPAGGYPGIGQPAAGAAAAQAQGEQPLMQMPAAAARPQPREEDELYDRPTTP